MPFLRFSRDKRGYANTYLCHTFRQDGIVRMRVLYWFRTPPDIEIGRPALDDDAIRDIEKWNPDLTFDWEEILKAKPLPPARDDPGGGRPQRRRSRGASPGGGTAADSTGAQEPPRQGEPRPETLDARPGEPGSGASEQAAAPADTAETPGDPPSRRRRRRRRRGRRSGDEGAAPESGGSAEGSARVEPDADRG